MKEKTYQFTCLLFCLCTALRVFTKIIKPAIPQHPTGNYHRWYASIMAESEQKLTEHIQSPLDNLGFIFNSKKSILVPFQEIWVSRDNCEIHIIWAWSCQEKKSEQSGELSGSRSAISTGPRTPPIVGSPFHDNNIRCFSSGLGSYLQWQSHQRSMVPFQTIPPHQLFETSSCHTSFAGEKRCISILLQLDNSAAVAFAVENLSFRKFFGSHKTFHMNFFLNGNYM